MPGALLTWEAGRLTEHKGGGRGIRVHVEVGVSVGRHLGVDPCHLESDQRVGSEGAGQRHPLRRDPLLSRQAVPRHCSRQVRLCTRTAGYLLPYGEERPAAAEAWAA